MTGHRPRRPARAAAPPPAPPPAPPVLIAAVSTAAEAGTAITAGADMIDATGLSDQTAAAIRARHRSARLWAGSPAAVDADGPDVDAGGPDVDAGGQPTAVAAVVARAAVLTWLGTPAIRTRHVLPVRRAIDMTGSIAGTRLPSLTTRGLG
jgi:hypothetical protein